jgi:hypothetical protein
MKRATIERLLSQAQAAQAAVEQRLGQATASRDPVWRSADAQRRQLVRRLRAVTEVERIDAELKARKAEAAAE